MSPRPRRARSACPTSPSPRTSASTVPATSRRPPETSFARTQRTVKVTAWVNARPATGLRGGQRHQYHPVVGRGLSLLLRRDQDHDRIGGYDAGALRVGLGGGL